MMVGIGFHDAHGSNIELLKHGQVARRYRSFANAIAFSHRPLSPGETFLFEIEDQELGWAGHIRCGVTVHNPNKLKCLPQYLLPDFAQMNDGEFRSWVYAIKPSDKMPFGEDFTAVAIECSRDSDNFIKSSRLNRNMLKGCENVLPTDIGSRIGIHVTLNGSLFLFINGIQFGPFTKDVPIHSGKVFAVVDLYGITKQIRIIQVEVPSLEEFSSAVIKQNMTEEEIFNLKIPAKIIEKLQSF